MIPLPRHRGDEVELGNRIFCRRAPVPVDGIGASFAACPIEHCPEVVAPVDLEVEIDGRLAWLRVERGLVDRLIEAAFPESTASTLDDELSAILLESAMAGMLARAEQRVGRRFALRRVGSAARPAAARPLGFRLVGAESGAATGAALWIEPDGLRLVASLLEQAPLEPAPAGSLPMAVSCRIGSTRLATRELRRLRPADLIVLESHALAEDGVELVVGGRLAFPARISQSRAVVSGGARRPMADDTGGGDSAGDLDSMPVTLVFELGRTQLALGELRTLAAGYSFDLGKDLRAPVDILANGQKIGSGELIQIDERIGVRVNRLFET
ncbi:MAG TPA: type III secretion system cytoplasmic ring protein SctQ [Geminicoccaceae bacterium]|nr:type III secretion system cytoplasmic ring protein SctQ [Geminicoccus sp.]HMU48794.1 type III secretion system cytoplasmic ring protein SctQ [Geminicoccaceae bacterium]